MPADVKHKSPHSLLWAVVVFVSTHAYCDSALCAESAAAVVVAGTNIDALQDQLNALCSKNQYAEALAVATKLLDLARKDPALKPEDQVKHLTNLALVHQSLGNYVAARPLFEEALKVSSEKLPANHSLNGLALNNLGTLIFFQGDFVSATPILEKALSETEAGFGPQSVETARVLNNLGSLYSSSEQKNLTVKTYERALKILDTPANQDSLSLAQLLNNLAVAYENSGNPEKSMALLKRAVSLKEKALGNDHLEVAENYNNIAVMTCSAGDFASALPMLEKAAKIYEKAEGVNHIDLANVLNNIGDTQARLNNKELSRNSYLKASKIIGAYLQEIFPSLSFAEQKASIDLRERDAISRLLSSSSPDSFDRTVYDLLLPWKGLLIESLAREAKLSRIACDAESAKTVEELKAVRAELASWYQASGDTELGQWRNQNLALTNRKESLQRQLAQKLGASIELSNVTSEKLLSALKPDEAFIDFYYYERAAADGTTSARYAAIVAFHNGPDPVFRLVELGSAEELNGLLLEWRAQVARQELAAEWFDQLSEKLCAPMRLLPATTTKIWLCPEAELACAPWQTISEAVNRRVSQVDSARELIALRSEEAAPVAEKETIALILGGVDFDASSAKASTEMNEMNALFHLPALPGSLSEAQGIAKLAREQKMTVIERTGKNASKSEVVSNLPQCAYAHLATHGYFMDSRMMDKIRVIRTGQGTRSVALISRNNQLASRNPLVESGIALAGANGNVSSADRERAGFLTAEEMVGIDMQKCRLITLSACDTGKGQAIRGQGLLGLRSAIMAGGCKSLLISLWAVPDLPTTRLMSYFYENLWGKHLSTVESLRKAKESLRSELDPNMRVPINWAGWELVGEVW